MVRELLLSAAPGQLESDTSRWLPESGSDQYQRAGIAPSGSNTGPVRSATSSLGRRGM